MKKWTIVLIFLISACGKSHQDANTNNVAQGNLGLDFSVPNFESNVTHKKGMIYIPHTPETGAIINFESKNYLIDFDKSSPDTIQLVRKLFRNQVDVRPYDQNATGTYYRARFSGKFNLDSINLQALKVY